MTNRPQPPPLRPILHKQEPQPPAQSLTRDRHRRPRATIFALAVHDFLHGFGRTQHVPGVHAETDFVHLAVGLCPFDDLAVGMGAELVGVSEEGEAFGAGGEGVLFLVLVGAPEVGEEEEGEGEEGC